MIKMTENRKVNNTCKKHGEWEHPVFETCPTCSFIKGLKENSKQIKYLQRHIKNRSAKIEFAEALKHYNKAIDIIDSVHKGEKYG